MTFTEKGLKAKPASYEVPLLEGGNSGLFTGMDYNKYKTIEKIAVKITAGRSLFSDYVNILFSE